MERLERGNDVWTEFGYDDRVRPTSITHNLMTEDPPGTWTVAEVVDARTLQWSAVHDKTQRADVRAGGPGRVFDYAYDDLSRMTTATITQPGADTIQWEYFFNDAGSRTITRRTVQSDPPVPTGFAFTPDEDTHEYLSTPVWTTREYDANGNLILLDEGLPTEVSFRYNHLNQMTSRTNAQGTTDYVYDALGRRIAKTLNGTTTRYAHFGEQVLMEKDATGFPTKTYVYGRHVDEVLHSLNWSASNCMGPAGYYLADDQFNVFALAGWGGSVNERYDYIMYGYPEFYAPNGTPRTESTVDNPYLFTGRRFDEESEWYYYRSRYYQPLMGQFTTLDSIGVWGDPLNMGNGYAYCGNNPWSLVDPYGLEAGWLDRLRNGRTAREHLFDEVASPNGRTPNRWGAEIQAGMIDFGETTCLARHVVEAEAFTGSLLNSVGYEATQGTIWESGQSYLDQAEEFKYSDPWVYYGTYAAHYTSMAASLSATGLMACEYIAATPGGFRGMLPGLGGGPRGSAPVSPGVTAARLPQDIRVNPQPPGVKPWSRPIATSSVQNALKDDIVAQLHAAGAKDIMVNQQQMNAHRVRVGINVPDIQATMRGTGRRVYYEIDAYASPRGPGHASRILANDPQGTVIFFRMPR